MAVDLTELLLAALNDAVEENLFDIPMSEGKDPVYEVLENCTPHELCMALAFHLKERGLTVDEKATLD